MLRTTIIGLLALWLVACSLAPVAPGETIPVTCTGEVHRQFDFWQGDWDVVQADQDAPRATNRIRPIVRGCVLHEDYHSATGFSGESISWYDRDWGQWRQVWADSNGLVLRLAGGLDAQGRMVLFGGERETKEGGAVRDRITWQPLTGGIVRQSWHISTDGGKSWRQIFSGDYHPRGTLEDDSPRSKREAWR